MKPKVYFTRSVEPGKVVEAYHMLSIALPGKIAVKIHSGEKGNQNYLRPEFWRPMVDEVRGTIVECNTAYGDAAGGVRDNTDSHLRLLEEHGWTKLFDVDLMDAEGPDLVWPIPNGKVRISRTMIPCSSWPTSRATRWEDTAEPSSSWRSAAQAVQARP